MYVFSFKFQIDDQYPKNVCKQCIIELDNAYRFKEKCEQTQENFRKSLLINRRATNVEIKENDQSVKIEQDDVEDIDNNSCQLLDNDDDNDSLFNKNSKTIVVIKRIIKREIDANPKDSEENLNREKKFICDICNSKYNIKFVLEQHMRNKHKMAKNLCECQYCGIFIAGREHTRHIHLHEKPFKCDICSIQFSSKQNLRRHIKGIHINPSERRKVIIMKKEKAAILKKFECNQCGKGFSDKNQLEKHKLMKEYGFGCDLCCKSFKFNYRLQMHKLTHLSSGENVKNFKCDMCGQCFADENLLNQHKLIKEYEFNCDLCCKSFIFNYKLQAHKLTHLSPAERKLYKLKRTEIRKEKKTIETNNKLVKEKTKQSIIRVCQICGKICTTSSNFFQHKLSHSDKKPYKCEYCNKWFKSTSQVTLHVRTHTGEKPYKCNSCDMNFTSSSH